MPDATPTVTRTTGADGEHGYHAQYGPRSRRRRRPRPATTAVLTCNFKLNVMDRDQLGRDPDSGDSEATGTNWPYFGITTRIIAVGVRDMAIMMSDSA